MNTSSIFSLMTESKIRIRLTIFVFSILQGLLWIILFRPNIFYEVISQIVMIFSAILSLTALYKTTKTVIYVAIIVQIANVLLFLCTLIFMIGQADTWLVYIIFLLGLTPPFINIIALYLLKDMKLHEHSDLK